MSEEAEDFRPAPRAGRRAGQSRARYTEDVGDEGESSPPVSRPAAAAAGDEEDAGANIQLNDERENAKPDAQPQAQAPGRKPVSGWGSDASSASSTSPTNSAAAEPKVSGMGRRKAGVEKQVEVNEIQDITEIPDLDDEGRDELTAKVADAPNVRAHRVQGLQELESGNPNHLPLVGEGIDLALLTKSLSPQENVVEPDEVWEFERLFSDVSSEMMAEKEETPDNEEEENAPKPDNAAPTVNTGAAAGGLSVSGLGASAASPTNGPGPMAGRRRVEAR